MTSECRRLAERLQEARRQGRWSEVAAVAQRLAELNSRAESAPASDFTVVRGNGAPADTPPGQKGLDPAILPLKNGERTRTAHWLKNWWSMAFPVSPKKNTDTRQFAAVSTSNRHPRSLIWVDAVGGFLVCTADQMVIGQPGPGGEVDIPIRGDLSRRHAVIHRDGEAYLIEPLRSVAVNGKQITRVTTLHDGDLLKLGNSVELRFRRPHPLSHTARLDYVSFHRTQPATDGIVLLADSCILGPNTACHIVCTRWTHEVVVYRQGDNLACRSPSGLKIDGIEHKQRGPLAERSQAAGSDWSFSIEPAE
jgi:FHA domain